MIAVPDSSQFALLALVAVVLVVAAMIKGTLGLGLPVFAVSILGSFLDPHTVLALMVMPVVAANAWQAVQGGRIAETWHEFWPLIVFYALATAIGGWWMARVDPSVLLVTLGVIAAAFAVINLAKPELRLRERDRGWIGIVAGSGAGVINGLSTVNGPPLLMYLMACDLKKEAFVGAYGLIAFAGTIPLALSYAYTGVLGPQEALWSSAALLPVFIGLGLGRMLRRYIEPALFRRILLFVLILLGINLIRRGLYG